MANGAAHIVDFAMRIALASDEPYPVHARIRAYLSERGHELFYFGGFGDGPAAAWSSVAHEAADAIAERRCEIGILLCWSGTGITMAANKVAGIRAALCVDPGSARAARQWNDANVLCLANRTLSGDMACEILDAWFDAEPLHEAAEGIALMNTLDGMQRRR